MVIVIAEDKMEMALRAGVGQFAEPLGSPIHGPKDRDARPAEVENIAAEHKRFRVRRRQGDLLQVPMGIRAIGEQMQVGNEVAFGHLSYYIGLARMRSSTCQQNTLEFFPMPHPPRHNTPAAQRPVSRRSFLCRSAVAGAAPLFGLIAGSSQAAGKKPPPIDRASLAFLKELAAATVESARVRPGRSRGGMGPNTTGMTIITPGGNYPALWTRDFAMSLDCGLIGPAEVLQHLRLIARCQNGQQERRLHSGGIVPPFAIVDHVNLAGGAVFYPGSYSSGEDQGAPPFGPLPPADDHFYFIHIAYALWRDAGNTKFLGETIGGRSLLDRLEAAFRSPQTDPNSGAVVSTKQRRAVGFGFQDSVYLLGAMSFATLLRYRAARQLADLCKAGGRAEAAAGYRRTTETIAAHFSTVFADPRRRDGWLLAATEVGKQPDVWATLFALHLGILPAEAAMRARETVAAAVRAAGHTIEYEGAVRHVPSDRYFRPNQCWQAGGSTVNTYQSGAFWHTPTGWLIEALQSVDPALARAVCDRFLRHLRDRDFRKSGGRGAPWECFGIDMAAAQNPVYMTSVTLPLAVLRRMAGEAR